MTAFLWQNLASSNASSSLRAFSGEPLILTCRALRYHPTSPFPDSVISSNFPSNQTGLLCGSYIIIAVCRHRDIYYLSGSTPVCPLLCGIARSCDFLPPRQRQRAKVSGNRQADVEIRTRYSPQRGVFFLPVSQPDFSSLQQPVSFLEETFAPCASTSIYRGEYRLDLVVSRIFSIHQT